MSFEVLPTEDYHDVEVACYPSMKPFRSRSGQNQHISWGFPGIQWNSSGLRSEIPRKSGTSLELRYPFSEAPEFPAQIQPSHRNWSKYQQTQPTEKQLGVGNHPTWMEHGRCFFLRRSGWPHATCVWYCLIYFPRRVSVSVSLGGHEKNILKPSQDMAFVQPPLAFFVASSSGDPMAHNGIPWPNSMELVELTIN